MPFEIGDAVQLKGGRSPIMTIMGFSIDGKGRKNVNCSWFDKTDKEQMGTYPVEAIQAYAVEKGSRKGMDDGWDWATA